MGSLQNHCIPLLYVAQESTHEFYNSADAHRQINPPQGRVHRETLSGYEFVWICGAVFKSYPGWRSGTTNSMRDGSSMFFIVCMLMYVGCFQFLMLRFLLDTLYMFAVCSFVSS